MLELFIGLSIDFILVKSSEVERVQKYSTQVKVPLHYWNFT